MGRLLGDRLELQGRRVPQRVAVPSGSTGSQTRAFGAPRIRRTRDVHRRRPGDRSPRMRYHEDASARGDVMPFPGPACTATSWSVFFVGLVVAAVSLFLWGRF